MMTCTVTVASLYKQLFSFVFSLSFSFSSISILLLNALRQIPFYCFHSDPPLGPSFLSSRVLLRLTTRLFRFPVYFFIGTPIWRSDLLTCLGSRSGPSTEQSDSAAVLILLFKCTNSGI